MGKEKTVLVVESPAKVKTISKILGSSYQVLASFGHVRDLPANALGIDIDNNFSQKYVVYAEKKDKVKKICDAAKNAGLVLLGTDPDREGEAISWHISELLPKGTKSKRIVFNAIEENALKNAIEKPRDINMSLVEAQKARRVLDRLTGYKGSSWLNRYLKDKGLSCGRVQSVALKFLVDREKEVAAFVSKDFWSIYVDVDNTQDNNTLKTSVYKINNTLVERKKDGETVYLISNEEVSIDTVDRIKSSNLFVVTDVKKKHLNKKPKTPYTTSTLQQDASTKLGFSVKKTMKVAQDLYEGAGSSSGYITYMRTDSVTIEPNNLKKIRHYIKENFHEYVSPSNREYASSKTAQEAHEAIRPINIEKTPEELKGTIPEEMWKLYSLVWKRTVASQMKNAIYENNAVLLKSKHDVICLKASSTILIFKGYTCVYKDDEETEALGAVFAKVGDEFCVNKVDSIKSTTKPPLRYSEASLVKKMEKEGIGRPSTYAPTIDRLEKYMESSEGKSLKASEKGDKVYHALEKFLPIITSVEFTSKMEENLELIEKDRKTLVEVVGEFWGKFFKSLSAANTEISAVEKERSDRECPLCKSFLYKIFWNNSVFYGCSERPKCKYTESDKKKEEIKVDRSLYAQEFNWEQKCSKCSKELKLRFGPYGVFLGCSAFPKCRTIVSIPKKEDVTSEICDLCSGYKAYQMPLKKYLYCIQCGKSEKA